MKLGETAAGRPSHHKLDIALSANIARATQSPTPTGIMWISRNILSVWRASFTLTRQVRRSPRPLSNLGRYLKDRDGEAANAILSAAGYETPSDKVRRTVPANTLQLQHRANSRAVSVARTQSSEIDRHKKTAWSCVPRRQTPPNVVSGAGNSIGRGVMGDLFGKENRQGSFQVIKFESRLK